MIRLQRISTADGFLYEYMEQLITAAFPPALRGASSVHR